ncbi:dtd protein [Lactobacillus selangorensis]|uniref:D-aminoacyl-tRNA deacylase n=1 Tax=Lactobacillus selangorensis TaxID=81857 RepID=A0A0R2FLT8_9LACO|nr:D-aminoacyl-tRNA deacylase [Lactobacillus selangorensis]KRN29538.1 dtd protein [Lactobacillus selangorensis]KRN33932.1 dtd protein [Lactobacillus selangorensis]
MRVVLQRVKQASVTIDSKVVGQIDAGLLLLVGFADGDTDKDLDWMVHKLTHLRIFSDENGKMNLSVAQIQGAILSVSQFTLYASVKKGNRPSFTDAGQPAFANRMYQRFNHKLAETGIPVATGEFGADMDVKIENDGPVTIVIDTAQN